MIQAIRTGDACVAQWLESLAIDRVETAGTSWRSPGPSRVRWKPDHSGTHPLIPLFDAVCVLIAIGFFWGVGRELLGVPLDLASGPIRKCSIENDELNVTVSRGRLILRKLPESSKYVNGSSVPFIVALFPGRTIIDPESGTAVFHIDADSHLTLEFNDQHRTCFAWLGEWIDQFQP